MKHMPVNTAIPAGKLLSASGKEIPMEEGPCIWCGEYVTSKREEAGCTNPFDPAWATEDGDYGCECSPETNEEGTGDHARPFDLAYRIMKRDAVTPKLLKALQYIVEAQSQPFDHPDRRISLEEARAAIKETEL